MTTRVNLRIFGARLRSRIKLEFVVEILKTRDEYSCLEVFCILAHTTAVFSKLCRTRDCVIASKYVNL